MLDFQLAGKSVGTLTVDRREVDGRGAAAHCTVHLIERHVKDQCGCLLMNVSAGLECLDEGRIMREMREEPQLDLGIVGRHEVPAATWDESSANVASKLSSDRNVLEIGIAR